MSMQYCGPLDRHQAYGQVQLHCKSSYTGVNWLSNGYFGRTRNGYYVKPNDTVYNISYSNNCLPFSNQVPNLLIDNFSNGFGQPYFSMEQRRLMESQSETKWKQPPNADQTVPQAHINYIQYLSQQSWPEGKVPHWIIPYLLKLLNQQTCPCPLTILTYLATNSHVIAQFSQYQLKYFRHILQTKYAIPGVDYIKQYRKLSIMDWRQACKLVNIMQIFCIIYAQVQSYNECTQTPPNRKYKEAVNIGKSNEVMIDEYIGWVVNYIVVLQQHHRQLASLSNTSTGSQLISSHSQKSQQIFEKLATNLGELITVLHAMANSKQCSWNRQQCAWLMQKMAAMIWALIPSNALINNPQQSKQPTVQAQMCQTNIYSMIQSYIWVYNMVHSPNMGINRMDYAYAMPYAVEELFSFIQSRLVSMLDNISNCIYKLYQNAPITVPIASSVMHEHDGNSYHHMHMLFQQSCFKILNALSFRIWTKQQKLHLLSMLAGFKFVCGYGYGYACSKSALNSRNEEDEHFKMEGTGQYGWLMEYGFKIASCKNIGYNSKYNKFIIQVGNTANNNKKGKQGQSHQEMGGCLQLQDQW